MTPQEVAAEYARQLKDLKMNSKPMINVLTMMAEDYIVHAPVVVQTIEKHLNSVDPSIKLPVLYLIDSIVKNVRKDYPTLFTQNIVSSFCGVFEKADDKVKQQMFKLRQTWNEVFPQRKLYAIDVRCHNFDKNWPISEPPRSNNVSSIHVNPKFLNTVKPQPNKSPSSTTSASESDMSDIVPTEVEANMRATLLQKQKELLELQAKKIELELQQTKAAIASKRIEEMESVLNQERLLMNQAEMAKNKTQVAHQILSSFPTPSQASSKPVVPEASKSSSAPVQAKQGGFATAPVVSTDPRLQRHQERNQTVVARCVPVIKSQVKTKEENHHPMSVKSRITHDVMDSIINPSLPSKINDPEPVLTKGPAEIQTCKIPDVVEIDLFESQSKKLKDYGRNSYKGKREDGKSKSNNSDRRVRDRSRSSERSRSSSSSYRKSKKSKDGRASRQDRKSDKNVSEDDYEDETKGFSGLTIIPKRASVEKESRKSSSSSNPPIETSIKPDRISPDKSSPGREKHKLSPSRRAGSPSSKMARSSASSHSPKEEFSPSRSPKKSEKVGHNKEKHSSSRKDKKDSKIRGGYKDKRSPSKSSSSKEEERDTFDARRSAVLKRNYRKNRGVEIDEEENKAPQSSQEDISDVDLRFQRDVDLRRDTDNRGGEPPAKKTRSGNNSNMIVDLFGREDVDLRQPKSGSGSWSQVKKPLRGAEDKFAQDDEDIREILHQQNRNRPPPPISPANSVSSVRSGCDPLGRPLLYNKLPDDPEERKRSLDLRSVTVDPLEFFRREYIDKALNEKGELSPMDVRNICAKGQELLNEEQRMTLMKQIQQINEASAMREVQQMQMSGSGGGNWPVHGSGPNPWNVAPQGPWSGGFQPRGPTDTGVMPRFGGPGNWGHGPGLGMNHDQWNSQPLLPRPRGPNPFEQALGPIVDDLIPLPNEMEVRAAERDSPSSIPIDKISRQLRFYGDIAVILMGKLGDDPRQISFKRDSQPKTVLINGRNPLEILIGEVKRFDLNGIPHTLKIGAPTRELYIDDRHYEIFFGGPAIRISLDGRMHTFELVGNPPEVEIGKVPRFDLIAGRVTLIVDAVEQLNVYLDEKPQKLDLFNQPVILRFCEGFHTVLLNGRPFPTNFGNRLPFTISIPNAGKHYLRFSALHPSANKAIGHFIRAKQMEMDDSGDFGAFRGRGRGGVRGRRGAVRGRDIAEHQMPIIEDRNPLDIINFLPSPRVPDCNNERGRLRRAGESFHSYESEFKESDENNASNDASNELPDVSNILALAARLGLLPSCEPPKELQKEVKEEGADTAPIPVETPIVPQKEEKPSIPPLPTVDVSLVNEEKNYMKERREILINQLWTGVQCATCGLRFPPDQAVRYAQHLDWHFRRNRREKSNSKKAQSRSWYYDLSDWIQFEEVEDLEERAASMFEIQEELEGETKSPLPTVNTDEFTVLASEHEGATCPQCGETFQTFFDQEKDEWRFRDAILDEVDGTSKVYHYICHQDYQKLLVEESMVVDKEEESIVVDQTSPEIETLEPDIETNNLEDDDEVLIVKEGKKEVVLMEIDVDDEDGLNEREDEKNDNEKNKEAENGPYFTKESKSTENNDVTDIGEKSVPNYSVIGRSVSSPIIVDDDSSSNLLPGISEDSMGGVFGVALIGIRPETPEPIEEKRIVYKSMEFEFPRIKLEPLDDETPEEGDVVDFAMNSEPTDVEIDKPVVVENVLNAEEPIDLSSDEDEPMEACDGANQHLTAIDGNLQQVETSSVPFTPPVKIRINISGLDISIKSPAKNAEDGEADGGVEKAAASPTDTDSRSSPSISENGDYSNAEIVFTEELKRLKPRLVGRKLQNCPPKRGKSEESGLCVIC